jgi:hypothetical protein
MQDASDLVFFIITIASAHAKDGKLEDSVVRRVSADQLRQRTDVVHVDRTGDSRHCPDYSRTPLDSLLSALVTRFPAEHSRRARGKQGGIMATTLCRPSARKRHAMQSLARFSFLTTSGTTERGAVATHAEEFSGIEGRRHRRLKPR